VSERVAIDLSEDAVEALDEAVASGRYKDRSEAADEAIRVLLRRADAHEDVEAVRRSYTEYPESESYGEAGLGLLADRLQDEESQR
jgi:Arc/MetJ-type ribon-helix-helix transcriptional regulator